MKTKYPLIYFIALILVTCSKSGTVEEEVKEYTAIPDWYFENALIEQGIDSDGKKNGKVLTSDIEDIGGLIIRDKNIRDLTGIQDFKNLIHLDASFNYLTELDISKNVRLVELLIMSGRGYFCFPPITNEITDLDVSKNTLLRTINVCGNPITCVKVNQEQFDNLDEWGWGIDDYGEFTIDYSDIFQLECN